jgi:hypothetical protein
MSQDVEGFTSVQADVAALPGGATAAGEPVGAVPQYQLGGWPMSDQQQTPLHKWEIVAQGERAENATTYRMRVPGGWLYRY